MQQLMHAPSVTINRQTLLEAMDDDRDLLRELVQMFLDDVPRLMELLRAAVAAHDADGLRRAAHSLVGNSCNFGDNPVPALARRLEYMGHDGNLAGDEEALEELEAAVDGLCHCLADILPSI